MKYEQTEITDAVQDNKNLNINLQNIFTFSTWNGLCVNA